MYVQPIISGISLLCMDIIEQRFVLAIVCCSVPLVNQSLQKDLEHHLYVVKVGVLMALVGLRRGFDE